MSATAELLTPIQAAIIRASEGTQPFTLARRRALAGVKWVLQTSVGVFIAPCTAHGEICISVEQEYALVFDGRDNETARAAFYSAMLKCEVTPVLISQ